MAIAHEVVRREPLERLNRAGRVAVVSGPAGSGKSVLLRSWADQADIARHAARIAVRDEDRDPRQFWTEVTNALRGTAAGSAVVRPLPTTPAPDGWSAVERLLADLGSLQGKRIWLVIDDVHTLGSIETRRQLELLLLRAPAGLRFVLASRASLCLGLHRLRLEGELTEIRADGLRFSRDEARALFEAAEVRLSETALARLHGRTEGWAAGLRLAALSLSGHPDPERFAAEFCGSERTVAEYLLAEVLERQSPDVRRLLSRTSVLERVNGPLADQLTGGSGGEQILQKLEQAGDFVVALDARRSWFRYHRLFADLLAAELRQTEPAELAALHGTAADWFAGHGFPVEAIRHAQAAQDWQRAGRLLADHWLDPTLKGEAGPARQLVTSSQRLWLVMASLLEASARDARQGTAHAAPIGKMNATGQRRRTPPALVAGRRERLPEPLSQAETRVLRFLPTSLSAPEIASELYVSVNTVRTHMRHVYDKLGAHRRLEAIDRARTLGLLTPVL